MTFSEIELPSNRKFGFFFTFVFAIAAVYFYSATTKEFAYIFAAGTVILFGISLVKANILLPLNKLWMRFGFLLGRIVSPIVLGIIFFGLFTPIALVMRLGGRDELCLKFSKKPDYWILRDEPINPDSFKNQF